MLRDVLLRIIRGVPLATEPSISLIILPIMRILQRNLKLTTDTFLLVSHTTNVLLFKFRCIIFIGVRLVCAQTSPDQVTLEGSSCTDILTCIGGCGYSF